MKSLIEDLVSYLQKEKQDWQQMMTIAENQDNWALRCNYQDRVGVIEGVESFLKVWLENNQGAGI